MAHEIEIKKDGSASLFYAGQTPWHGLGQQVEKEVTSAAALRFAQLDWSVEKRPLFFQAGQAMEEITDKKAVVRLEDEKILGIVTNSYEPIQNKDAFEFLDALVGEGLAMFHTAGSLFGGKRVFICCKMPKSMKIGPDLVDKYLVAMTSHDGSTALHIKWTPIRVVCNNTMSAAFGIDKRGRVQNLSDAVSIYHTKNYKDRVSEARRLLGLANTYYERIEECFSRLIETPMDSQEFDKFTKKLHPMPQPEGKDQTAYKAVLKMWENKQQKLADVFQNGIGMNNKRVAGTRWAAFNAVTEYIDHHKTYRGIKWDAKDSRFDSIVYGHGADIKNKALELLAK